MTMKVLGFMLQEDDRGNNSVHTKQDWASLDEDLVQLAPAYSSRGATYDNLNVLR